MSNAIVYYLIKLEGKIWGVTPNPSYELMAGIFGRANFPTQEDVDLFLEHELYISPLKLIFTLEKVDYMG